MNGSQPAAPTLLSLTAPPAGGRPAERADGERFTEELTGALGSGEVKPNAQAKPAESGREPRERVSESENGAAPQGAVATPSGEQHAGDPEQDVVIDLIDPIEEGLFSIAVATETIVLETPPDTVLPPEAVTSIDVDASAPLAGVETSLVDVTPADVLPLQDLDAGATEGEVVIEPEGQLIDGSVVVDDPAIDASEATVEAVAALQDTSEEVAQGAVVPVETEGDGHGAAAADVEATAGTLDDAAPAAGLSQGQTTPSAEAATADVEPIASTATESPEAVAAPLGKPEKEMQTLDDPAGSADASAEPTQETASPRETGSEKGVASSREASEARGADNRPTVDPSRFVSRVSRAIDVAQQRGGGPVEMRLSPPELGSLQVRIEVKEGVMTATLDVETPAARNALLDNLPALRDRLEQQNIRIDKFDVDVRDDNQQRGGDQQQGGQAQQRSDSRDGGREPAPTRPAATPESERSDEPNPQRTPPRTIVFGDDGINLVA